MGYNKLNPLEKELLIRQYRNNPDVKLGDFCRANTVSDPAAVKAGVYVNCGNLAYMSTSKMTIPSLVSTSLYERAKKVSTKLD